MIPTKIGGQYAIGFINPQWAEFNYNGPAIFNGELDGFDDPNTGFERWYGFNIKGTSKTVFFAETDIIGELL